MPQRLARDAEQLAAGRGAPVDLLAVMASLNLRLAVGDVADKAAGHNGTLRRNSDGIWEVVLFSEFGHNTNINTLTPRERFTIAHEIGHYVIDARFGFQPRSNGEYWRLEGICDEFARSLLIPQWLIRTIINKPLNNPFEIISYTAKLAKAAFVSPEPAARAVSSAVAHGATFASLKIDEKKTRLGVLRWQISNCNWKTGGRNSYIDRAHPLAPALEASKGLAQGETRSVLIDGVKHACIERGKGASVIFAALL